MNYLEGLRRLTVIVSIVAAISTIFLAWFDNSAKQQSELVNENETPP